MSEKKKGMPALAYVGIGCLALVIVGVIGISLVIVRCKNTVEEYVENPEKLATDLAVMAIKKDPNLEFISNDAPARTISYRDKKSGKEITVTWDEIVDGKFTVTSGDQTTTVDGTAGTTTVEAPEGTTTIDRAGGLKKVPKWIEVPAEVTEWKGAMRHEKADGTFRGSVSGKSQSSPEDLVELFKTRLEAAGFTKVNLTESSNHAMLNYERKAEKQSFTVTVFRGTGESLVTLGYTQR